MIAAQKALLIRKKAFYDRFGTKIKANARAKRGRASRETFTIKSLI